MRASDRLEYASKGCLEIRERDIAIIAPTSVEWLGMLDQIPDAVDVDDVPLPIRIGTIGGFSVLCFASGKGQEETASAATLILERAKPSWVFLVGIAGGDSLPFVNGEVEIY